MTAWWTVETGTLIGAYGGAGVGVLCGLFGATVGVLAPRGIGARPVLTIHAIIILAGAAALIAGVVAAVAGQPYHVYYPLLLGGAVTTGVMGGLFPVIRIRYREADARKMAAGEIRGGAVRP